MISLPKDSAVFRKQLVADRTVAPGRGPWPRALCAGLVLAAASTLQAQMWIRESTVLPDSVTGGGMHDGEGGTLTFTNAIYGGLEYNDNATLSESGAGGLALRAGFTTGIRYPVSRSNELKFDISLERLTYLSGVDGTEDYNSLLPGSETTFTIYAGPIRVRNFLRAELTEDPVETPVVNNTARFGRFNGYLGTQLDWDMNRVIWQLTGSVGRQFATESANSQIDYWTYGLGLRAVFPLGPSTSCGVSASQAINLYDLSIQNESVTRTLGVFGQTALTRKIGLDAAVGLQTTNYDQSGTIADQDDYAGVYGSLGLSHQLQKNFSYALRLRHDIDEGYGTNFYQITEITLTPKISSIYRWEVVVPLSWQWVDVSGPTGDTFTRLGIGVEARRPLGRKLDLSVGASHYEKFTDVAGAGYAQNRVYFSVRYNF